MLLVLKPIEAQNGSGQNIDPLIASKELLQFIEGGSRLTGTHRGWEMAARPCRWVFGRSGDADVNEFMVLFSGKDPKSGRPLLATPNNVIGFNANYSVPASVSAMWTDGDDEKRQQIVDGIDAAVLASLRFASEHMFKIEGLPPESKATDILAVDYFHTTRRLPVEPQLHHHVLICNFAKDEQGRVGSLKTEPVLSRVAEMNEIFETGLHEELTRSIGAQWTVPINGIAEIEGAPRPPLELLMAEGAAEGVMANALVYLLGAVGLQISQACALNVEDLSYKRGTRAISVSTAGPRHGLLTLPPAICRAVEGAAGNRSTGPLLLDESGNRMGEKAAQALLDRLATRAGIETPVVFASAQSSVREVRQ